MTFEAHRAQQLLQEANDTIRALQAENAELRMELEKDAAAGGPAADASSTRVMQGQGAADTVVAQSTLALLRLATEDMQALQGTIDAQASVRARSACAFCRGRGAPSLCLRAVCVCIVLCVCCVCAVCVLCVLLCCFEPCSSAFMTLSPAPGMPMSAAKM